MKKWIFFATILGTVAIMAGQSLLRDVELTVDPPTERERTVVNLSFTPTQTVRYDRVVFSCTLRQTISVPGDDGEVIERYHEPVKFEYVRKQVRATKDLRHHIHFPVPTGLDELREQYGRITFPMDGDVTIPKVRVTAFNGEEQAWQLDLKPKPSRRRSRSSMSDMMR